MGWPRSHNRGPSVTDLPSLSSPAELPSSEHLSVADATWLALNVVSGGGSFSSSQPIGVTKIAKSVIAPLADQNISVFMLSTYQTDFILVKPQPGPWAVRAPPDAVCKVYAVPPPFPISSEAKGTLGSSVQPHPTACPLHGSCWFALDARSGLGPCVGRAPSQLDLRLPDPIPFTWGSKYVWSRNRWQFLDTVSLVHFSHGARPLGELGPGRSRDRSGHQS